MPLSKEKQSEWMREYRKRRYNVIPTEYIVRPSIVMPKPEYIESVTHATPPNLDASGEVIPDYY